MADRPRRRMHLFATLLVGLALAVVAQLLQVQVADHQRYAEWARIIQLRLISPPEPPRGSIRDRNGDLLAGNQVCYAVGASLEYVIDAPQTAEALAPVLNVPVSQVLEALSNNDEGWVRIASPVPKEVGEAVTDLGLPGITTHIVWQRRYPGGMTAGHLLGFMGDQGYYGLEGFYEDVLSATVPAWWQEVDPWNIPLPLELDSVELPEPGTDLYLALDRTVQAIVETELARSVAEFQADGGTIIVMDPRTGAVLAMASFPAFDPSRYEDSLGLNPSPMENPAVSWQYEPGSVFKVVTMAAALDTGLVTPDSTYYDEGWIEVGGQVIENADRRAHGRQTMRDLLVYSLNVGAAGLSKQLGPETFYRYVRAFGVGERTGVDLAGEAAGQLRLPSDLDWHDSDLGTNSFGQGLAVTPLQMISAVAAIANGGTRMRPCVVARQVAPDGSMRTVQPVPLGQPVSPETARVLTEMLVEVVERGVPKARVPGYRIAGKTGTAEIPIPGGYDPHGTIASFVGYGPASAPQLIILVKLDRPRTSLLGMETATVTFQRLASRLFVLLEIPPDDLAVAEW